MAAVRSVGLWCSEWKYRFLSIYRLPWLCPKVCRETYAALLKSQNTVARICIHLTSLIFSWLLHNSPNRLRNIATNRRFITGENAIQKCFCIIQKSFNPRTCNFFSKNGLHITMAYSDLQISSSVNRWSSSTKSRPAPMLSAVRLVKFCISSTESSRKTSCVHI